jgi:hypothetical protein
MWLDMLRKTTRSIRRLETLQVLKELDVKIKDEDATEWEIRNKKDDERKKERDSEDSEREKNWES